MHTLYIYSIQQIQQITEAYTDSYHLESEESYSDRISDCGTRFSAEAPCNSRCRETHGKEERRGVIKKVSLSDKYIALRLRRTHVELMMNLFGER